MVASGSGSKRNPSSYTAGRHRWHVFHDPLAAALRRINLRHGRPWLDEAAGELAALGPEQTERGGTPLFFRKTEQRPESLRAGQGTNLHSQQILVAGMFRPAHLLDLVRKMRTLKRLKRFKDD